MLTGELPFTASDPMEWVHCHIARQPAPPQERVAGIPGPLSAIVMKLLAKNAEDRYQGRTRTALRPRDLSRLLAVDFVGFCYARTSSLTLWTLHRRRRILMATPFERR